MSASERVSAPSRPGAVPLFADLGTHVHPVTTSSALAQKYFDQGLRLVYAFNPEEGRRAFEEAARLDPQCAMAWWGVALALGPNINVPRLPDLERAAAKAIARAQALAAKASEPERGYIEALARRYLGASRTDGKALDSAYADAMRALSRRYPDDLDAATLYAESLMDLRPWQLWTRDGQPQPRTLEIVATLEAVLQRDPDHPGANHFYVHALEASPNPEKALAAAERLPGLMPGAGHIVHMPFHIYMRMGKYNQAAAANEQAVAVDRAYIARNKPQGIYPMMYYPHNLHSWWASLAMEGRSTEALEAARQLVTVVSPEAARKMQMVEFAAPTLLFTLVRFGKWDEILKQPRPPSGLPYLTACWHYARGFAFAAQGRSDEAKREHGELARIAAAMPPDVMESLNSGAAVLKMATSVLAGEIAARQTRYEEAVGLLEDAVRQQDALNYDEPPPWYYPVRQSLGAVLLAAGRASEAQAVYLDDLRKNPENGWSLYGLMLSFQAQNEQAEAENAEERLRAAWARADVTLSASRF